MGQPLSMDLRSPLLAAVDAGMSCSSAACRFGVAPSTEIRWQPHLVMTIHRSDVVRRYGREFPDDSV
jgi:hypothetical protein